MLNPWWLNEKSTGFRQLSYSHFSEEKNDFLLQYSCKVVPPYFQEDKLQPYPIAILPPHIDKRIIAQKSVFTIHGGKRDGLIDLCVSHKDAQMAKLCLDGSKTGIFKDQLITAGITETSVFPDLDGLAREIKREYNIR